MNRIGISVNILLERRWIWALLALFIAGFSCICRGCNPPPPPVYTPAVTPPPVVSEPASTAPPPLVSEPASTELPEFTFTLRRQAQEVLMGATRPLSPVTSDSPQPFPEGYLLNTNSVGEALLEGDVEGKLCHIYVFFDSWLQKKACPESTYTGSNASCVEEGSAVYRECSNHLVTTGSGELQMMGTWASATYFPDQRLSIFIVLQGEALVRSITDIDRHEFVPEEVVLTSGQFLYTAPDGWLEPIPGLAPRQPHSLERLPALLPAFDILPYFEKIGALARGEDLYFPSPELLTGPPDLVIHLESTKWMEQDLAVVKTYPELVFAPVYAIINNQGGQPAGIFKVSVEGTAGDGTFLRSFIVPGQDSFYYAFTTDPLPPGGQVVFRGLVGFPSSLTGQNATLVATVDSCAGEEFFVAGCRVPEQNEDNNLSNPLDVLLSVISFSQ